VSLAALIAAQRVECGIPHAVSCRALGVSQAWFYKWRRGDPSLRRKRRVETDGRAGAGRSSQAAAPVVHAAGQAGTQGAGRVAA